MRGLKDTEVIVGDACFVGPATLAVGGRHLSAPRIFLDVGGRAVRPALPGIDTVHTLDNVSVMELDMVPEHLVVVGGSFIGLEFAQMMRRLGAAVTVVERLARLLPREGPDVSDGIRAILEAEGASPICSLSAPAAVRTVTCTSRGAACLRTWRRSSGCSSRARSRTACWPMRATGTETAFRERLSELGLAYVVGVTGQVTVWPPGHAPLPPPPYSGRGIVPTRQRLGQATHQRPVTMKELARSASPNILAWPVRRRGRHAPRRYVLAMKHGLGLNKIFGTIHTYPTLAEANKSVAGEWKRAHAPQRVLRWAEKYHAWQLA